VPDRRVLDDEVVEKIANLIIERGQLHASGQPLFFTKHNLVMAIKDAVKEQEKCSSAS
jgi:hypothetical protein